MWLWHPRCPQQNVIDPCYPVLSPGKCDGCGSRQDGQTHALPEAVATPDCDESRRVQELVRLTYPAHLKHRSIISIEIHEAKGFLTKNDVTFHRMWITHNLWKNNSYLPLLRWFFLDFLCVCYQEVRLWLGVELWLHNAYIFRCLLIFCCGMAAVLMYKLYRPVELHRRSLILRMFVNSWSPRTPCRSVTASEVTRVDLTSPQSRVNELYLSSAKWRFYAAIQNSTEITFCPKRQLLLISAIPLLLYSCYTQVTPS